MIFEVVMMFVDVYENVEVLRKCMLMWTEMMSVTYFEIFQPKNIKIKEM